MNDTKLSLLIVEDDPDYREALADVLAEEFTVTCSGNAKEALQLVGRGAAVVLLDIRLNEDDPLNKDGLELLKALKASYPELPVVMMTAYSDIDLAVDAMKLGAADFIQKARLDVREFRKVLHSALERSMLERRVAQYEEDLRRLEPWELVGDDPKMDEVRSLVELVAKDGYTTVLIRGETGAGKEVAARAIHSRGWRKKAPFVTVALPALQRELIESELFGHVKGAFTDAQSSRIGYIEKAHGGVLFLDEIGELSPDIQVKLLRVLETKTFARVGSTEDVTVDVQIVCATNRNLEEAIQLGQFREDLYFRLRTVQIHLPPLHERPLDIPLLVDHFLFLFRQAGRTKLAGISPGALQQLANYRFPGNVRELKSVVERAMMLAGSRRHSLIDNVDLLLDPPRPPHRREEAQPVQPHVPEDGVDLDKELARSELAYIQEALKLTEGRKSEAWRLLRLNDRFALRRRVKRIDDAYPDLVEAFPIVRRLYHE